MVFVERTHGEAMIVELERLRKQVEFERASLQAAFRELRKQDGDIERLRQRVEVLEGHLNGALNLVENFAFCDTTDARKALEGK